jgi:hypothetical protein
MTPRDVLIHAALAGALIFALLIVAAALGG